MKTTGPGWSRQKIIRTKSRDGRRLPSNEPRSYEIAELRDRHYRMIELSFLGYSEVNIAEILGVTKQNVSDVLNSQLAKDHIEVLRAQRDAETVDIAKQIKELAPEALRLMRLSLVRENQRLINDPDATMDRLHFNAAQDILDRSGFQPPKQQQNLHLHLTPNDINSLKTEAIKKTNVEEAEVIE